MRLEFLYIEKYRAFETQGFDMSNEFSIDFDPKARKLTIRRDAHYLENFFGENISAVTGIVGRNGSGKTTLLNYIKEELSFPKAEKLELNCILLFYNQAKTEFLLIDNLPVKDSLIKINGFEKIKIITKRLQDLKPNDVDEFDFTSRFTLLESIPGLDSLAIMHLATALEPGRGERDYGRHRPPLIMNYSTNYLIGRIENDQRSETYWVSESKRILSLIVDVPDSIPEIKYPNSIRIGVAFPKLDELIKNKKRNSTNINAKDNKFNKVLSSSSLQSFLNNHKTTPSYKPDRFKYWLSLNLILDLIPFINEDFLVIFCNNINPKSVDTFYQSILATLSQNPDFLTAGDYWFTTPEFWEKEFLPKYNELITIISELVLVELDASRNNDNYNSINIALTKENHPRLSKLLELIDATQLSTNPIINFVWSQSSHGEVSMLSIFARLYDFKKALKSPLPIDKIWFFFDECESHFHPQWQKQFNDLVFKFIRKHFSEFRCQIFLASHSPFSISDLPKKNVLFLNTENGKSVAQKSLNDHKQTFGANIHQLLTDSFFLQNGLIGDFANHAISEVIDLLYEGSMAQIEAKQKYIENIINIIGEPIIQNKLLAKLENRLRANILTIKEDLDKLNRAR